MRIFLLASHKADDYTLYVIKRSGVFLLLKMLSLSLAFDNFTAPYQSGIFEPHTLLIRYKNIFSDIAHVQCEKFLCKKSYGVD